MSIREIYVLLGNTLLVIVCFESVSYVRGSRFFVWVAPCSGNELAAAILRHHKRVREKV